MSEIVLRSGFPIGGRFPDQRDNVYRELTGYLCPVCRGDVWEDGADNCICDAPSGPFCPWPKVPPDAAILALGIRVAGQECR
jgi:hypothetical protein